jgi:hypothetical protein
MGTEMFPGKLWERSQAHPAMTDPIWIGEAVLPWSSLADLNIKKNPGGRHAERLYRSAHAGSDNA